MHGSKRAEFELISEGLPALLNANQLRVKGSSCRHTWSFSIKRPQRTNYTSVVTTSRRIGWFQGVSYIMLFGFVLLSAALVLCKAAHVSAPPGPTLQAANVSFKYGSGRVLSFFGVYHQSNQVAKNHTDIRVKVDASNLRFVSCDLHTIPCVSPGHPGSYRVVCDRENLQALVNHCVYSASGQLELLILCVSVTRAQELLTTDGLSFNSDQLTVVLVNRSDDSQCPLFERVSNDEITASTNVSVTVKHSGTCQLDTILRNQVPTGSTQTRDANLALLSLFAIGLIAAVAGIWIAAVYLKRRFKLFKSKRSPQVTHTFASRCGCVFRRYPVCMWVGTISNPRDVCHPFWGHSDRWEA